MGQYQVYFAVLEKVEPNCKLYTALSKTAYEELRQMETFDLVVERYSVALFVVRIADEEIETWRQ